MSKMAEIAMQIDELVEQGMSAKFIAVTLNVPMSWVLYSMEQREELELQKQQEFMSYGDE